jgi:DNA polymerase-1
VQKEVRIAASAEDIRELAKRRRDRALARPETIDGFDAPIAASLSAKASESLLVPIAESFGGTNEMNDALRELLASDRVFVTYDAKAQTRRLHALQWPVPSRWEDVMLMSYVINPGLPSHALANIARDRLKQDISARKEVQKTAPLFALDHEVGASKLGPLQQYLGEKSEVTVALREVLEPELRRDEALPHIYEQIEMPLFPVLGKMEERGIRIDVDLLRAMSKTFGDQIADLERRVYAEAGMDFNINSPIQLGHVLFEKLQYPVIKKTKTTKSYSTSVEVLEELARHGFVVPQLILQHRELHKLKGTYIDALPQLVGKDGRVHTTFNQAVAATGRLSSSDEPTEHSDPHADGREIRKAFIADEGWSAALRRLLAGRAAHPRAHFTG